MKYFIFSFIALVLLVVGVFGLRGQKFSKTPIEVFPDMDRQDYVQAQTPDLFFRDGQGARLPVGGTLPHASDDGVFPVEFGEGMTGYYYQGAIGDYYGTGFPEELALTAETMPGFLRRGEERYGIYCAICHGESGDGKGVVSYYGIPGVANLHTFPRATYPDGRLYGVITYGKGNMGAYGANIPVRDRWAIVAYVRALQASQKTAAVPAEGQPVVAGGAN